MLTLTTISVVEASSTEMVENPVDKPRSCRRSPKISQNFRKLCVTAYILGRLELVFLGSFFCKI
jgi:hypothetical protein